VNDRQSPVRVFVAGANRQMMKRRFPRIGSGEGMTSFIHIADAASACCAFVEKGTPGVYNIADDEPATANQWMPALAEAVGAKPPLRVPAWLARLFAGAGIVAWAMTSRGASNAAVKREIDWRPVYARQALEPGEPLA
jgi:nucleoside-diphosphate-sugar epimerase